jgi:hypothetical protein
MAQLGSNSVPVMSSRTGSWLSMKSFKHLQTDWPETPRIGGGRPDRHAVFD